MKGGSVNKAAWRTPGVRVGAVAQIGLSLLLVLTGGHGAAGQSSYPSSHGVAASPVAQPTKPLVVRPLSPSASVGSAPFSPLQANDWFALRPEPDTQDETLPTLRTDTADRVYDAHSPEGLSERRPLSTTQATQALVQPASSPAVVVDLSQGVLVDSAQAKVQQALAAYRQGLPLDAVRLLKQAVTMEPQNSAYWLALGQLLLETRQPTAAVAAFQQAYSQDPQANLRPYAEALAQTVQVVPSNVERLVNLAGRYPKEPLLAYILGTLLLQDGRPRLAVEQLNRAIFLEPHYANAHFNLGVAYQQLGQTPLADQHFGLAKRFGGETEAPQTPASLPPGQAYFMPTGNDSP